MKADEFKITTVLTWKQRFIVPLYQRQYQWHDDRDGNRTAAFWRDIAAKAADILEGRARFEHYMGALLLAPSAEPQAFGTTPTMQVVDGQQRLTTFLILIAAIKHEAMKRGLTDIVTQCDSHLFTTPGPNEKDPLVRYKLTPTPVDREVFIAILDGPAETVRKKFAPYYRGMGVPKNTKFRSLRAYEYFLAQIKEFVENGLADDLDIDIDADFLAPIDSAEREHDVFPPLRLSALLEALVFHLKLIVITLGEEDDAQVIFETLNSAGQPLLAMDLVRNNIFHRAEAQYKDSENPRQLAEKLYREVWEPFDDGWWRDQAPNARPNRPRIDHFLAHVLTAESGERTTVRELYAEYRAWANVKGRPRFDLVADELAVLQRHAPTYEALEGRGGGNEVIQWLGERLRVWQNTTAYPVALQIGLPEVDDATRGNIARIIDSYLTRRALCDLTPKNLNQIFPRLASALKRHGISMNTVKVFFESLQHSHTAKFPTDADVLDGILEKTAYGVIPSRVLTHIFWEFELRSRTAKTEATARPSGLWVEHIMPRSWMKFWPLLNEENEPAGLLDPRYVKRQRAIHTLGNLTVVTSSLNISLQNGPFDEKKKSLIEHSNLTLNRRLSEEQSWDEIAIRKRGESLAKLACEIWPSL